MSFISLTDLVYPVGAIYQSTVYTSPAALFGGSWVQIKYAFLYNSTSSMNTGGESEHTLTVSEMPTHSHNTNVRIQWWDTAGNGGINGAWNTNTNAMVDRADVYTKSVGGGQFPQQYASLLHLLLLDENQLKQVTACE